MLASLPRSLSCPPLCLNPVFPPPPGAVYTSLTHPRHLDPPPLFPSLYPPPVFRLQHFSCFPSEELGQLLLGAQVQPAVRADENVALTYTCATGAPTTTTTTSTLTLRPSPPFFFPLYPCLTFTVFISLFSISPFSFLSFSASVSLAPNPACQAWLHAC